MPALRPSPAPRSSTGTAGLLPAKSGAGGTGPAEGDRYRFAKWRAPGR